MSSNMALNLAPFGRWTALKRRRLALRYAAMETGLVAPTAMTYSRRDAFVHRNAALHSARLRLPV
jgi:hypothetical protein